MRFVILVPTSLDPVARGRRMPLPDERPSAKIAKLFPQVDPLKSQQTLQNEGVKPADTPALPSANKPGKTTPPANTAASSAGPPASSAARAAPAQTAAVQVVPLPQARPGNQTVLELRHSQRHRRYRRGP
jgi:membrane-bound lytic murein transglycosylase A